MSTWTSRFGNLGRFSPFTRSPTTSGGSAKVSDSDFSYITADDLRRHQNESVAQPRSESPTDYGPSRETDMIVLRNKRKEYAMHFPAYSIVKGDLKISSVREAAAKKMNTSASRVKLLHKGKNLKDDLRTCKQEGLKDGSEIMCTVAEGQDGDDSDSDAEDEAGMEDGQADGETSKKRRNRGKKTKRRNRREASDAAGSGTSTPTDNLNIPRSEASTRPTSPKPPATPATPIDKIKQLHNTLLTFDPDVKNFLNNPPPEQSKREFEHKRLSETILTQVLLKLDAVETDGDPDARSKRKELVKETQGVLTSLDEAMKR